MATVAFGVRNYQNLSKGLIELNRVLKPSGQLVVLEFSMPKNPILSKIYQWYFKNILPQIGRITSKDPAAYDYLFRSVQAFPDGQNFLDNSSPLLDLKNVPKPAYFWDLYDIFWI